MKIERIQSSAFLDLENYLKEIELRGNVDLSFEVYLFNLLIPDVTNEDILAEAHPNGWNRVDFRQEINCLEMQKSINKVIEEYLNQELGISKSISYGERIGELIEAIFPEGVKQVIEVGWHVPYVNIYGGCTFLLFSDTPERCLLFIANTSD